MKKKFFLKNLAFFLAALLIPLLILGAFSLILTHSYIGDNIEKNNSNMLIQSKENVEMILKEIDSLSLNFGSDPTIIKRLKSILSNNSFTIEELDSLDYMKNYIDVPANSKPYIHSIYVYFDSGNKNFISSTQLLSNINNFNDSAWYKSYQENKNIHDMWSESREIRLYDFDKKPVNVTTIYKSLYSPGSETVTGVVVLNIITSYVDDILKSLSTLDNQCILVTDSSNNIIFKNNNLPYLDKLDLGTLSNESNGTKTMLIDKQIYSVSILKSDRYKWNYISIVPYNSLYKQLEFLRYVTFFLLLMSAILGMGLAYYITRKNYKQIENIITILDSAEKGSELPAMPSRVKDEYGYILQNILKTFIEQSYLKVQLSERKYKMQLIQMVALQSQINPHFLYNTLHTIYWETLNLTGRPNKATTMISHLTDILEYSLSNPNETVTLDEEIKHTKNYLDIQKVRYKDKFEVFWEYDSEITQYMVIKLLLQPLIENAIYHGIKEKQRKGGIKIKLMDKAEAIRISIIDNGLGLKKEKLSEIRDQLVNNSDSTNHIGLFNTNKRLVLKYGEEYGLKIQSKYNLGTAIHIIIPKNSKEFQA